MGKNNIENIKILNEIITGRVVPSIYAFSTNAIPNYLKVGDTYRSVSVRLNEWKKSYPDLIKLYENEALIDKDNYFRDYAVHQYIENDLNKERLHKENIDDEIHYSKEFFKDVEEKDLDNAIKDIKINYAQNTEKYEYYLVEDNLPKPHHYDREESWDLRPNQKQAVEAFVKALKNGRRNLLMYAVMRFGKSFTSLCCAIEMNEDKDLKMDNNLILVVSAKADVKEEWKKTVETAGNFIDFVFLESCDLLKNENIIKELFKTKKKIVLFLTLQDLQGESIKDKHKVLFEEQIDLLIVDETHFGARAKSYGKKLRDAGYKVSDEKNTEKIEDDQIDIDDACKEITKLNARVRLHLSGTPYRILMGSEFEKEDIISFVQFSDIVKSKEEWDNEYLNKDDYEEWDNPYYGFPQMIRFAFNPNQSSRKKMEEMQKKGISFALSCLLEPVSIKKDNYSNKHKLFKNSKEVLDLLQVIDGSKNDEELFGFLDYDKIKNGNMCRHIVMVLPYCASCDAMEKLILDNKKLFKNLNNYEIINISGLDASKTYKKPNDVKNKIKEYETKDKKTLTLTVNRMLTGSTVEEWDTMIYFKDTSSPQEYDQAIFRLQNQYLRKLSSKEGIIKENLKPQTLLVDFSPNRLFRIQEQKSLIYNVNVEENGNNKLKDRITEELRISPIIVMNKNRIKEVNATDILEYIGEYNNQRSVSDEVEDIPVDLSILEYEDIRLAIERQAEFNSKKGLTIEPTEGEGDDMDLDDSGNENSNDEKNNPNKEDNGDAGSLEDDEIKKLENKIRTYYQRILFYAFLTKDSVSSLDDILNTIDSNDNIKLANNLSLDKDILKQVSKYMDPFKRSSLDYKIQNISNLANDQNLNPLDRALTSIKRFNRMSESEVITPSNICDDMVMLFDDNELIKFVNNKNLFLDLGTKSGEYAVALYKHLTHDLGLSHNKVKDSIVSIPTSSIAYEFTRKFYEILDLNTDNISVNFNAYDLLSIKTCDGEIDYTKINNILKQDKKFSKISLEDKIKEGDAQMKFGAIVGNPPYQISDGGAQASAQPIYQHFVLLGEMLTTKYACWITPTRWFAGGKGLDDFRTYMLNNRFIKEMHDFLTPDDVFFNTNNRGGVCYFIEDKDKSDVTVKFITHKNNKIVSSTTRQLKLDNVDILIRDSNAYSIINKIINNCDDFAKDHISSLRPFGFRGYFIKDENYKQTDNGMKNPVVCIGKGRKQGFVERALVKKNLDWIDKWKVFMPRANNISTELPDDNLNAYIAKPNVICTESYLVCFANDNLNEEETSYAVKYMKSKFLRYLHSLSKSSQDATSKTFRFVPMQDFSSKSDIDWDKSIEDIDNQLYDKYKLTSEEREHINNSIKDM